MIQKIENILGITASNQVLAIYQTITQRLLQKLGGLDEVPEELEYIVVEATVSRYNRIGSEGTSSHNVEGESMSWSGTDDLAPFADDINEWLGAQDGATKGVVTFL